MPGAARRRRPHPQHPRPRRLRRVVVAGALALVVIGVVAAPAGAHADLAAVEPRPGAVLDSGPRAIRLWFTERVDPTLGGVSVYDGDGRRVSAGRLRQPSTTRLVLPLGSPLPDGAYVVTWRAISEDTHRIQGTWTFRVGAAAPTADTTDLTQRLLDAQRADRSVAVVWAVLRAAVFAALALLVGVGAFAATVWPRARRSRAIRRLLEGAAIALGLASVLSIGVFGAYSRAGGPGDVVDPEVWRAALDTRLGGVSVVRLVLAAAALVLARVLTRPAGVPAGASTGAAGDPDGGGPPRWWAPAAVVVGLGLVVTPGWVGHAGAGDDPAFTIALDAVHVAAMAVWLGGLVALALAVRRDPGPETARDCAARFSRVAWWCVGALVVSGALQAWQLVGGWDALRTTEFGRMLLVKLVVVALMLAVAVRSREVLGRFTADRATSDRSALLRSVVLEAVLGAVVLVVTALLVNTVPPTSAARVATASSATTLSAGTTTVDVTVVPGRVGYDDLHVVTSRRGEAVPVVSMALVLTPPTGGAPLAVPLRMLDPGHGFAPQVELTAAGRWRVVVTVVPSPGAAPVEARGTVAVRPADRSWTPDPITTSPTTASPTTTSPMTAPVPRFVP